jgi:hypothetical protein
MDGWVTTKAAPGGRLAIPTEPKAWMLGKKPRACLECAQAAHQMAKCSA